MNYDKYTFRRREMISFLIAVTVLFLLIGKLFSEHFWQAVSVLFFSFFMEKEKETAFGKAEKAACKRV